MSGRFPARGVLALLGGVALLLGLGAGWRFATLTESDVIEAAAARYVAEHGGRPTDCVGQGGVPPAWVTVLCQKDGRTLAIYQADRFGRLTTLDPADPADAARIGA